jgi:hypothetical protein
MLLHRYCRHVLCLVAGALLTSASQAQVQPPDTTQLVPAESQTAVMPLKDSALPLPPPSGARAHLYRMNYWVSGGFSLAATAANIYAIPNLIKSKSELTDAELAGANPDALNDFERWALHQDPSKAERIDKSTDYLLQGILASTVALGFDKAIRKDALRLLTMYVETHAVTFSIYNFSFFGPLFQNKLRPIVYYKDVGKEERRSGNNKNSQYSGHTASAAASTFFMAKVFNDYHPEFSSGKKYLIYGLAAIPPLVEGYYRVKALKHFPSDVLIGFVIGATCGVAVPEMHRFKRQAIKYSVIATPVGPGISLSWTPGAKHHAAPIAWK